MTTFPKSLNLPALTCLHLGTFVFCASNDGRFEPFLAFNRLNNLIIDNCTVKDAKILCISSLTLVSLTICSHCFDFYKFELSAPNLSAFAFLVEVVFILPNMYSLNRWCGDVGKLLQASFSSTNMAVWSY